MARNSTAHFRSFRKKDKPLGLGARVRQKLRLEKHEPAAAKLRWGQEQRLHSYRDRRKRRNQIAAESRRQNRGKNGRKKRYRKRPCPGRRYMAA